MRSVLALLFACLALVACSASQTDFPIHSEAVRIEAKNTSTNVAIVRLTADNIDAFNQPRNLNGSPTTMPSRPNWNYHVGVGDVLNVVVWNHPELTMPAGPNLTPVESGLRVEANGTFFYPYVGQIRAAGRTTAEIRQDLTQKLVKYIKDPQLEVQVVGYNSQTVSVTGEVNKPSRLPLQSSPLTLLDAINAAGGLTAQADPRTVTVRRDGRIYVVNMQAFLQQGIAANNPVLINGDVVSVPQIQPQEAYLLGQVAKPGPIDLTHVNVTLTQALTSVGGLNEGRADARGIFVFRNAPVGVTVYQLDAQSPTAYLVGAKFIIHPQDVIYVTTAPLAKWNTVISDLLPTLSATKALQSSFPNAVP